MIFEAFTWLRLFLFFINIASFCIVSLSVFVLRLKPWCGCEICQSFISSRWSLEFSNLCDWYSHLLQKSETGTIRVHVLGNIITANPENVEYMLKTRFDNYPKGKPFSSVLGDLLGRGIFNVDGHLWKFQRKIASLELSNLSVKSYAFEIVESEIRSRLIPLFSSIAGKENGVLDLQDVFQRFSFDSICKFSFGLDPGCLNLSLPVSEFSVAFDLASKLSAERALTVSPLIWKIKRFFNLGSEKKLRETIKLVNVLAEELIKYKRNNKRYDVAMGINALGAMHVQKFARNCSKIEMFVHVSTAYVQGSSVGFIPEKAFHMGETPDGAKISYLDINTEKKIVEERLRGLESQNATELEIASAMRNLGIDRAKLHGWSNTYVFTKAMGEMLLEKLEENVKLIIVRPTIITSTYKEPFSGWTESIRTLDSIFVAYGKGKLKFFVGDPNSTLDMIPGDMVVNSMLVAMAMHSNQPSHRLIYHIGSSLRNPLKYEDMRWLMYNYLTKNPLLDTGGKPIKIEKVEILETMASFHRYIAIRYLPFIQMLKLVNMILCNHFGNLHANAIRRIDYSIRLAELYKPYLFFQGIFDDTTAENLRTTLIRGSEVFNFDPKCIQWENYFMNTHFPGITKFVLK